MSDYLFAQPSYLSGVARLLDLGGIYDDYNTSASPLIAEETAMMADALATARDIFSARQAMEVEVRKRKHAQEE